MLLIALIISGSISKDATSSVSLLQLDPLSGGVVSSCSLPQMPGAPRYGHTMTGDLACGGSPGRLVTSTQKFRSQENILQVISRSLVSASV